MLKKESGSKPEQTRIRLPKDKKAPVNRKLLLWLFVLTGIVSLLLWWRGRLIHGIGPVAGGGTGEIRFVINPTPPKAPLGASSKQVKNLLDELSEITSTASGKYAVYVYHLSDGTAYGVNEKEVMPGASILKIPVIITAMKQVERGELKLEDEYTLEEADRSTGSGPLQFKPAGTSYSIDELLTYLGKNSDNTAWVMFNRRFGKKVIQDVMDEVGLTASDYGRLTTTAADVARMWEYLYQGQITEAHRKKVWGYLTGSIYEDRIPTGLAQTGAEVVGHKVGTDLDVWADAGIVSCQLSVVGCKVKPFVMVIMNQEVKRSEAQQLVPEIAKLIWETENDPRI